MICEDVKWGLQLCEVFSASNPPFSFLHFHIPVDFTSNILKVVYLWLNSIYFMISYLSIVHSHHIIPINYVGVFMDKLVASSNNCIVREVEFDRHQWPGHYLCHHQKHLIAHILFLKLSPLVQSRIWERPTNAWFFCITLISSMAPPSCFRKFK